MSLETYEVFPAVITGTSTLNIRHVENVEPSGFPEEMMITGGGSVDPLEFSTAKAEPMFALTSRDLLAILTTVGIASGFKGTGKFQYRQQESGSDFVAGANHVNVTTPAGFLYIDEFGGKQNDKEGCDIKLKYHALYFNGTVPATFNAAQALTSSVGITGSHSLGPINFENQAGGLGGVQSCRVKPGLTTESLWSDGGIWPTTCRIKGRVPVIEIEGHNMTLARNMTLNQVQKITNGITCYFLKNEPDSGRYAFNQGVHISVTATEGIYKLTGLSGAKGTSSITKIEVRPKALTINVAAAVVIP